MDNEVKNNCAIGGKLGIPYFSRIDGRDPSEQWLKSRYGRLIDSLDEHISNHARAGDQETVGWFFARIGEILQRTVKV